MFFTKALQNWKISVKALLKRLQRLTNRMIGYNDYNLHKWLNRNESIGTQGLIFYNVFNDFEKYFLSCFFVTSFFDNNWIC